MSNKLNQALKQANAKVGAIWINAIELFAKYPQGVIVTDIENGFNKNGKPEFCYFFDGKDEDGEDVKYRFSSRDVWYSRTERMLKIYEGDIDGFFEDLESENKALLFIPLPKPKGKNYYEAEFKFVDKPAAEVIDKETGEVIKFADNKNAPF